MSATTTHGARTSVAIHDLLASRWSPRAYDPARTVSNEELTSLLEAARWAPSASNLQPRRLLVFRRGTPEFDRVVKHLTGRNPQWATNAAVLVVGVAELRGPDGAPRRWAQYDLGQSIAHLTVQAQSLGLSVRQMGGIDAAGLAGEFGVPDRYEVMTVTAVGHLGDQGAGVSTHRRERLPLAQLVNPATW
ncbi:MAG: nitroreductase family protein [Cellulomonadaceae bacterium]